MKKLILSILAAFSSALIYAASPTPVYTFSWDGVKSADVVANSNFTDTLGVTTVLVKRDGLQKSNEMMATKVRNIEMDLTKINSTGLSIGSLVLYMKNGSSSQNCTVDVYYQSGEDWVLTDEMSLAPQAISQYSPANLPTKSLVSKVKFVFSLDAYLYTINLYSNSGDSDADPVFVSSDPVENDSVASSGVINVRFDKYIKTTTSSSSISFGDATVFSKSYQGNCLIINYYGLTSTSNLIIPQDAVTDLDGNAIQAPVSLTFNNDSEAPVVQSVSPAASSTIHIQDLGEYDRMIKVKFNEKIALTSDALLGNLNVSIMTENLDYGNADVSVEDSTLVISYKNLDYNNSYTFTIPSGFVTDLSGNVWAGQELSYYTGERDSTSPSVIGQSIANGDADKDVSGSIQITFNEDVQILKQGATVNGKPVVMTVNKNVLGINYNKLDYSAEQTVELPAGCVADTCGNEYSSPLSFAFTTKSMQMSGLTFIVGQDDGYGFDDSYNTIQEAVDAIVDDSKRTIIYVRPGVYREKLVVDKSNVSIIGQNRDSVIIVYNDCASISTLQTQYKTGLDATDEGTAVASYTMLVAADNFYGENFTVRNNYDWKNGTDKRKQNVALCHTNGDNISLNNVSLEGVENVYFSKKTSGRVYMRNCRLMGGTDILTSGGTVVADSCSFKVYDGGKCLSAAYQSDYDFGIILLNSDVALADTTGFFSSEKSTYLIGHPKKTNGKITMKGCYFGLDILNPSAWSNRISDTENADDVYFYEYNGHFADGDNAADLSNRSEFVTVMTKAEAANVNADRAMNLGSNGGVWNPQMYSFKPDSVVVTFDADEDEGYCNLSWNVNMHDKGYLVYKNGNYLDNVTSPSLMDYSYSGNDIYEVAAYNEYGALSATSLNYRKDDYQKHPADKEDEKGDVAVKESVVNGGLLEFNLVSSILKFKQDNISNVEIYNLKAEKVMSTRVNGSESVSLGVLAPGSYVIRGVDNAGAVYVERFIVK